MNKIQNVENEKSLNQSKSVSIKYLFYVEGKKKHWYETSPILFWGDVKFYGESFEEIQKKRIKFTEELRVKYPNANKVDVWQR